MLEKISKYLIPISIVISGVIIAGVLVYLNLNKCLGQGGKLSAQEIGEKVIKYINENFASVGGAVVLDNVVEDGGVYKISLKVGETKYESYATRDGEFLFPEGYKLNAEIQSKEGNNNASVEIPKSDRPDIKLFVMSYCPYGLQSQKMFLPVYNLLKEKTEMGVYFVSYIMHEKQEIDENLRQYCIQKEEKEKYYDYLSCFVQDGNFEKCLSETNINKEKLESCISETDKEYNIYSQYNDKSTWLSGKYPKFDIYSELNNQYGVQGSPTIVINDQVVEVDPRSPEKFKEVICQAFNSPPGECSQTLSNETPSSGLGVGTSSSSGEGCEQ